MEAEAGYAVPICCVGRGGGGGGTYPGGIYCEEAAAGTGAGLGAGAGEGFAFAFAFTFAPG